jgi:hypothetical protein
MDESIKTLVIQAYAERYDDFKLQFMEPVDNYYGGYLIALDFTSHDKCGITEHSSEICYVDLRKGVRIFGTTTELVHLLIGKANESFLERFFRKDNFTSFVFLVLVVAVLVAAFRGLANEGIDILRNLTVLAAGFFFGSRTSKAE